jgi:hypothetical protein
MNTDNLRLQGLIDALTAQLQVSMHTAMTNIVRIERDGTTGRLTLVDEEASEIEAMQRENEELQENNQWLRSENDRLTIERRTLLTA